MTRAEYQKEYQRKYRESGRKKKAAHAYYMRNRERLQAEARMKYRIKAGW